jgi:hypothetical protein
VDDLAEPAVRGAFRVVFWLIRFVLEALFEYVIETACELSRRRTWLGWLPVLALAAIGGILGWLALSDGQPWAGAIVLAVLSLPAAARAIYVAVVPAASRKT